VDHQEHFKAQSMPGKVQAASAMVKRSRAWIALGLLAAIVLVGMFSVRGHFKLRGVSVADSPKLLAAVQAFSRDQMAQGRPTPESVTLVELVAGGYIATRDIRAFEGMDVTISLTADGSRPQQIMIRVKRPGLTQAALFG
jgi:hypothetical protein